MAQLVASASGVVLVGGVAEVVGSNLARGKIFTASIGSVDSLYPSVYIYICLSQSKYWNAKVGQCHKARLKRMRGQLLYSSDFVNCAPCIFCASFVSGMQSFYFGESEDAIVLQTCHLKKYSGLISL